jgi:hypothetical protein
MPIKQTTKQKIDHLFSSLIAPAFLWGFRETMMQKLILTELLNN